MIALFFCSHLTGTFSVLDLDEKVARWLDTFGNPPLRDTWNTEVAQKEGALIWFYGLLVHSVMAWPRIVTGVPRFFFLMHWLIAALPTLFMAYATTT